jgi:hypothetical protein
LERNNGANPTTNVGSLTWGTVLVNLKQILIHFLHFT